MPRLIFESLRCLQRSDLTGNDEPYFIVSADSGEITQVYPLNAKGKNNIKKGDISTVFAKTKLTGKGNFTELSRTDLQFNQIVMLRLREDDNTKPTLHSEDDLLGHFEVISGQADKGTITHTFAKGSSTEYVLQCRVESDRSGVSLDRPRDNDSNSSDSALEGALSGLAAGHGDGISIGPTLKQKLTIISLKRLDHGRGAHERLQVSIGLTANQSEIIRRETLKAGEEMRNPPPPQLVQFPLTLVLTEQSSDSSLELQQWSIHQLSEVPVMPVSAVSTQGESFELVFSIDPLAASGKRG